MLPVIIACSVLGGLLLLSVIGWILWGRHKRGAANKRTGSIIRTSVDAVGLRSTLGSARSDSQHSAISQTFYASPQDAVMETAGLGGSNSQQQQQQQQQGDVESNMYACIRDEGVGAEGEQKEYTASNGMPATKGVEAGAGAGVGVAGLIGARLYESVKQKRDHGTMSPPPLYDSMETPVAPPYSPTSTHGTHEYYAAPPRERGPSVHSASSLYTLDPKALATGPAQQVLLLEDPKQAQFLTDRDVSTQEQVTLQMSPTFDIGHDYAASTTNGSPVEHDYATTGDPAALADGGRSPTHGLAKGHSAETIHGKQLPGLAAPIRPARADADASGGPLYAALEPVPTAHQPRALSIIRRATAIAPATPPRHGSGFSERPPSLANYAQPTGPDGLRPVVLEPMYAAVEDSPPPGQPQAPPDNGGYQAPNDLSREEYLAAAAAGGLSTYGEAVLWQRPPGGAGTARSSNTYEDPDDYGGFGGASATGTVSSYGFGSVSGANYDEPYQIGGDIAGGGHSLFNPASARRPTTFVNDAGIDVRDLYAVPVKTPLETSFS